MDVESAFFVLKWFGIIQTGGPMPTDDPESADEMFEPFSSPGLFARARKLRSPG
jgi:hypothetical protein